MKAFVIGRIETTKFLGTIRTAKEDVPKLPGVDKVYTVSGNLDLIIEVEASNLSDLSHLVDNRVGSVSGVQSTETLICW